MSDASDCPRGYRFPKMIIAYAIYLYHRFLLSYRDVQELLFERGVDASHETVRAWCIRFGPDIAEGLRYRKPRRGRNWHLDEMRVVVGGVVHWLWRAINEHGDVLDVLLQENRDTSAAKRFFRRLIDDHDLPERIVTDRLRSYGAAIREVPELSASEHVSVSAAERQNNLIEQSHRATRDQERQQKVSEMYGVPNAFFPLTLNSAISFAIPVPVHRPDYAAVTGWTIFVFGACCRLACPKKPVGVPPQLN